MKKPIFQDRATARAASRKAVRKAAIGTVSLMGVGLAAHVIWFLTGGMHDLDGLLRRVLFTLFICPLIAFPVGYMLSIEAPKS